MIAPLAALVAAVTVTFLALDRQWARAVAVSGAPAAGAVAITGSVAVPPFYAVTLVAVAATTAGAMLRRNAGSTSQPIRRTLAGQLLLAFFAWCCLITLASPLLPAGTNQVDGSGARWITSSNVAQLLYLALGLWVCSYVATARKARESLIAWSAVTCVGLSFWRYLATQYGVPFPFGFFDNSTGFNFIETGVGGESRFRGVLSEPAALGGVCSVAITYAVIAVRGAAVGRRVFLAAVVAAAIFLGVESTSASFIVVSAAVAALAVLQVLWRTLTGTASASAGAAVFVAAALVVAAWVGPRVLGFINGVVAAKTDSTSFDDRSSANADAYAVFLDSHGLGVGLGSVRASSIVPTALGAVGIVGVFLLAVALAQLLWTTRRDPQVRGARWCLVTVAVGKVIAGPDLSDTTGVLWICVGLLLRSAMASDRERGAVLVRPSSYAVGEVAATVKTSREAARTRRSPR